LLIVAPPTRAPTFTHFPYTTLFRSTNGKIMHTERFIATIFAAQFCEAGFAVRGHILQPLRHFLWSASAQVAVDVGFRTKDFYQRSEEHTSELQSRENLVCRLLLEKK